MNKRKVGSIVAVALSIFIFVCVACIFFSVVRAKTQGKMPSFFGYSFSIVVTPSMSGEIEVGDLLISKECDIEDVEQFDNILFISKEDSIKGQVVVHKAIFIDEIDGEIEITTKGVNNASEDRHKVTKENFIGKEVAHSSFLGKVVMALRNPFTWIFVIVLLITVPIIIKQTKNIIKLAKEE